ncbi:MAG: hypothetical protein M3186_00275 [Actinomycetota bacterium]|nr:hypothetical protein [Actinomycetota bacterium]
MHPPTSVALVLSAVVRAGVAYRGPELSASFDVFLPVVIEVTGGFRGVDAAIARRVAKAGADVAINYTVPVQRDIHESVGRSVCVGRGRV